MNFLSFRQRPAPAANHVARETESAVPRPQEAALPDANYAAPPPNQAIVAPATPWLPAPIQRGFAQTVALAFNAPARLLQFAWDTSIAFEINNIKNIKLGGDYEKAYLFAKKLATDNPMSARAQLAYAEEAASLGELVAATEAYQRVATMTQATQAEEIACAQGLAVSFFYKGDMSSALQQAEHVQAVVDKYSYLPGAPRAAALTAFLQLQSPDAESDNINAVQSKAQRDMDILVSAQRREITDPLLAALAVDYLSTYHGAEDARKLVTAALDTYSDHPLLLVCQATLEARAGDLSRAQVLTKKMLDTYAHGIPHVRVLAALLCKNRATQTKLLKQACAQDHVNAHAARVLLTMQSSLRAPNPLGPGYIGNERDWNLAIQQLDALAAGRANAPLVTVIARVHAAIARRQWAEAREIIDTASARGVELEQLRYEDAMVAFVLAGPEARLAIIAQKLGDLGNNPAKTPAGASLLCLRATQYLSAGSFTAAARDFQTLIDEGIDDPVIDLQHAKANLACAYSIAVTNNNDGAANMQRRVHLISCRTGAARFIASPDMASESNPASVHRILVEASFELGQYNDAQLFLAAGNLGNFPGLQTMLAIMNGPHNLPAVPTLEEAELLTGDAGLIAAFAVVKHTGELAAAPMALLGKRFMEKKEYTKGLYWLDKAAENTSSNTPLMLQIDQHRKLAPKVNRYFLTPIRKLVGFSGT